MTEPGYEPANSPPSSAQTSTIAFAATCLLPAAFPQIAYGLAVCGIAIAVGMAWGWQRFK